MTTFKVDSATELRQIALGDAAELFALIEVNRTHLRPWHPKLAVTSSLRDVEQTITTWQQQSSEQRGMWAGIWYQQRLCGVIGHINIDWDNRVTWLCYWLDQHHQGKGIMSRSCLAFVGLSLCLCKLHRITIECGTENRRSRALAERLGFRFEGILREAEWIGDHYIDHAVYGLLCSDWESRSAALLQGSGTLDAHGDPPTPTEPQDPVAPPPQAADRR